MRLTYSSDNFARANANPIGGNWTTCPGTLTRDCQLLSNKLAGTAALFYSLVYWNALSFANDQWSEITLASLTSSASYAIAAARVSASAQHSYNAVVQGPIGGTTNLFLQRLDTGGATNISTTTATVVSGDRLRVEVKGTTITVLLNDVQKLQASDFSYASGSAGLGVFPADLTFANCNIGAWSAGIFSGASRTLVGTGV